MLGLKLLGLGTRTVTAQEIKVGDTIKVESFKALDKRVFIVKDVFPSDRLPEFYWVLGDGVSELLHRDKKVQLLRRW